jgi:hypothetical protein
VLARALAAEQGLTELLRRLPAAGLLPADACLVERLIGSAPS